MLVFCCLHIPRHAHIWHSHYFSSGLGNMFGASDWCFPILDKFAAQQPHLISIAVLISHVGNDACRSVYTREVSGCLLVVMLITYWEVCKVRKPSAVLYVRRSACCTFTWSCGKAQPCAPLTHSKDYAYLPLLGACTALLIGFLWRASNS